MIRFVTRSILAGGIAASVAGAAFAHHNPMDGYDTKAPVVLKGEITRVDWTGEHVRVHVRTTDGKTWSIMTAPAKTMRENGLDESAFGILETVTIRGYQSIDKACKPDCLATGSDVTFADGLKVKLDGTHAKEDGPAVHKQRIVARARL